MKIKKGGGCKKKKYKNKRQRMYDFRREKILAGADFCSKILRHEKIKVEDRNNRNLLLALIVV